ncbi:MAG: Hsp70 family protein [Oscillospiraceae bacterium]|nr:Hsp70 family protein [Oscillospiraceae bacterium]
MPRIVGIDLGTTYSVIACVDDVTKMPKIIPNKYGKSVTPSVIGFREDGYVIGEDAKAMEEMGDVNTASFYKLHMGDHSYKYSFFGKEYTAADLSAMFMRRLIEDAEKTVVDVISKAVITVPAYFEDAARNDTIKAGKSAGLEVLNIINEPTAACVAYGLSGSDKNVLVYDLGGGTFDVTIAKVTADSIDVIGTIGHHRLGGRDWDSAVADWLTERFESETGVDLSADSEMAAELMVKAENAKKQLTASMETDITVDDGTRKRKFKLTRGEFEDLTVYQLGLTTDLIARLFKDTGLSWNDIDGVVPVGGSTKMPMVKDFILSNGVKILSGVHPDEAVAIGAAVQANIGRVCATLPGTESPKSSLGMKREELNLTLMPGARMISDVIPHSLGMIIENAEGTRYINDIMIPRNTKCRDARKTKRRELSVSSEKSRNRLDIYLLQGESSSPEKCTVAKRYVFRDIDYVDGGKSVIEITFAHTINGTIDIKAVQTETGLELPFCEKPIPDDMSWVEKSPRGAAVGALVMALDLSGSMRREIAGVKSIDAAKVAMKGFAEKFRGTDIAIGIIGFSDADMVLCRPTTDMKKIFAAINELSIGMTGGGNYCNPLTAMFEELRRFDSDPFLYAIVLTDGEWYTNACCGAIAKKADFISHGMDIIGMGFGDADYEFLKSISTREELANVDDITHLGANLSNIAKEILNQ